jgi:hypothetical protein
MEVANALSAEKEAVSIGIIPDNSNNDLCLDSKIIGM